MTEKPIDSILRAENINKSFDNAEGGKTQVLRDLSFSVGRGEFLTILGASGCGKTTLLRILCGLESADSGQIFLDGQDITDAEPHTRPVNTVFQSYALFPHMTVWDNIAYPLKLRHLPKKEIGERVSAMLSLVSMNGFEKRYPAALSGGQKQRIAIARALVGEPQILLLDEPLGALDFHLRRRMQSELKRMQKTLGITFIYITHDQEEALNMSDRIALMRGGRFIQLDTPQNIYDSPADTYAARFVGESNLLPCVYHADGASPDTAEVRFADRIVSVRRGQYSEPLQAGAPVTVSLRAEALQLASEHTSDNAAITGTISEISFVGGVQHITFQCGGTALTAVQYGMHPELAVGMPIRCILPANRGVLCHDAEDNGEGL